MIDRELKPLPEPEQDMIAFIKEQSLLEKSERETDAKIAASLIIGFYWKKPWSDEELAQMASRIGDRQLSKSLLKALGEPGQAQLKALKQREK